MTTSAPQTPTAAGSQVDEPLRKPYAIHRSEWARREPLTDSHPRLDRDVACDVLVIGAGITGLSAALELLQRGKSVVVCEAGVIGSGTTGGSTGFLDPTPEMGCRELVDHLGEDTARRYVQARSNAIDTIEQRAADCCDFARLPAVVYTEDESNVETLRDQCDAAGTLGLAAMFLDAPPVPRAAGGFRIDSLGRIDPLAYIRRLATLVIDAGGQIFERSLAASPSEKNQPQQIDCNGHTITATDVVCATHSNFTGNLRLYIETPAYQSYVLTVKLAGEWPEQLAWDDSDPYYYLRPGGDRQTLIVGGCDHRTGEGDERQAFDDLEKWVRERFDVTEEVSRWSAELFEPVDRLPLIGLAPGYDHSYVATGLSGVGLTLGTLAGEMIARDIAGDPHELSETLSPSRLPVSAIGTVVAEQAVATKNYAEHVLPSGEVDVNSLTAGQGCVGKVDGDTVAVCRTLDGTLHKRSPVCSHMKGIVHWNEAEQTWDCPVHGGRFHADGCRLYGPPESDLADPS